MDVESAGINPPLRNHLFIFYESFKEQFNPVGPLTSINVEYEDD